MSKFNMYNIYSITENGVIYYARGVDFYTENNITYTHYYSDKRFKNEIKGGPVWGGVYLLNEEIGYVLNRYFELEKRTANNIGLLKLLFNNEK